MSRMFTGGSCRGPRASASVLPVHQPHSRKAEAAAERQRVSQMCEGRTSEGMALKRRRGTLCHACHWARSPASATSQQQRHDRVVMLLCGVLHSQLGPGIGVAVEEEGHRLRAR